MASTETAPAASGMRSLDLVALVVLSAIWGMSYVFIRVASPIVGPAPLMASRFLVSAGVLAAYVRLTRGPGAFASVARGRWGAFAVMGILSGALPTTLIGVAELRISASLASVLNASVPFWTAAAAALWLRDRLSAPGAIGLVVGFAGVGVAVGGDLGVSAGLLLFVLASLLAALSYGIGAVFIRRTFQGEDGVTLALGLSLLAGLLLIPVTAVTAPPTLTAALPLPVVLAAAGLALLSTAVAYVIYFRLIETAGPTRASTVTFLSPIVGVAAGHLLLGEATGIGLVFGLALVLVGMALVTRGPRASQTRPANGSAPPPARAPRATSEE
jgi:drug/metabolite transporter (DMT)-like permease